MRATGRDLLPTAGIVGTIVVAGLLGAFVPTYVALLDEGNPLKLLALPAAMLLALWLAWSRHALLLFIVLLRGSTELLFDASRMGVGGAQIGIGGLINGFAILIALMLVVERPQRFPKAIVVIWGPFLAMLAFGVVITPNKPEAIRLMLQLLSNLAVCVGAFYYVRTEKDFRTCLWLVLWSSLVPTVYGFVELASGGGYDYAEGLRIKSTFSHPNVFAFYLTMVVAVALYFLRSTQVALGGGKRVVLSLYLVAMLVMLMLTKTRSAWVACFVMFFVYASVFERRFFVYLALAAIAALFVPGVGDRLIDLSQGTSREISSSAQLNSFAWRESIWTSALDWMNPKRYPLGYGLEAFRYYAPVFFKEGGGLNWGAHSIFVEIFFELGIVGIAAFLWMWGALLASARALARHDRLAAFVVAFVAIAYLVTGASDNMLHYLSFNWYVWFLFGAALADLALRRRSDARATAERAA